MSDPDFGPIDYPELSDRPVLMPGQFHLTDVGNAQRLVAQHRDSIRYCPPRDKWFVWDMRRWAVDETGEIVRRAKETVLSIYDEASRCRDDKFRADIAKHAAASERKGRIDAMIALAESEPGVPVMPADLDADPWLLNVENGTVDLRTGELRGHRRSELITKLAPSKYDPDARSPLWEEFLATATGEDPELQDYLARVVGYSLQGTAREKAFFFVFGPPDTSKSTFLDAVATAIGDYHRTADFDTWLIQTNTGGNRGDLVRLAGVRLVTSVEVRPGARFDTSLVKRVTGGDPVTAAAKYEVEITFAPQMTLVLAANDAPLIRDDDDGMWARVRVIPFTKEIPPERRDVAMREKLAAPEVRTAILAWAVRGCREWLASGVGSCAAVEASTANYRESQDRVAGFFHDCCLFNPVERIPAKNLRAAYLAWCDDEHIKPLAVKELAARLEKKGCEQAKSNGARMWRGVTLTDGGDR